MKFSNVFASVVLASVCSASPIRVRQSNRHHRMNMAPKSANAAGAVYFITNDPTRNFVVSADVASTGELTLRQAIATGGIGAHGVVAANGPDALFSQGSIKTSSAINMLATVNPGSNTLSLFSINPSDPAALTPVGEPVSSEGEFPMSLAFNANGTQVCALNGGQVNGVACFTPTKNGLVAQTNNIRSIGFNQTTPPSGPAGTASHVIFSEDGTKLIASVKGVPPTPGFLAVWDVAADGTLSQDFQTMTPGTGGLLPFGMANIPGKNAVLVTDPGSGFDIFDLSGANRSSVVPVSGQGAVCWAVFSKQTGNFYLTDIETSLVTEVNIDDNLKGTIVKQYSQGNGSGTIDDEVVTVGGKDFLYVLSANATTIDALAVNTPGNAQPIQKLQMSQIAAQAGLPLSGFNVQGLTAFVPKA